MNEMEQYAERAIEIINELYTERLDYESEYVPLIDAAHTLKKYEGIGTVEEFAALKQAENEGRLVELPRKVGDVVYHISKTRKSIQPMKITSIILHDGNIMRFGWRIEECDGFGNIYLGNVDGFRCCDLGKTVFLTREAAEAALAAKEGERE